MKPSDYVKDKPVWCPGCGDFGVLRAVQQAFADLNLKQEDIVVVSGIGCSGKFSSDVMSYGFHGIHGRLLPVATGVKLANSDLTVVGIGGDGDGYSIGMNHFIHALRRNMNITYIVLDNRVYGLTKGQTSPTSDMDFPTKMAPVGSGIEPVHPISLAMAAGGSFVAQGFSSDVKELTGIIKEGIQYDGFSFINVFSPCVTFNHKNTYDWFRAHIVKLSSIEGYDPFSRAMAIEKAMDHTHLYTGLFYMDKNKKSYNTSSAYVPAVRSIAKQPLKKRDIDFKEVFS